MAKSRLKLDKYVAGNAAKFAKLSIVSGAIIEDVQVYAFDTSGNIDTDSTISGNAIKSTNFFKKKHKNIQKNTGVIDDLFMQGSVAPLMNIEQFGDYLFSISRESTWSDSMATNLSGAPWIYSDDYYQDKHQITTYDTVDLTAAVPDSQITNHSFDIEEIAYVYGFANEDGDGYTVFAYPSAEPILYAASNGLEESLPASYLYEFNLNYAPGFKRTEVYGLSVDGTSTIVASPSDTFTETITSQLLGEDEMIINSTQLKNYYDQMFEMHYDRDTSELLGLKIYNNMKSTQEAPWMSYKYQNKVPTVLDNYEFIEHVKALYKLEAIPKHKSNMYSIRINNSGLNKSFEGSEETRQRIQDIIKEYVFDLVEQYTPAHTQLLGIAFLGR